MPLITDEETICSIVVVFYTETGYSVRQYHAWTKRWAIVNDTEDIYIISAEEKQKTIEQRAVLVGEIELCLVLLTVLCLVATDPEHAIRVRLVVHAHVALFIEQQANLVPPELAVRLAHDDVIGARSQVRRRARTIGNGFRPDELAAQDRYRVLVRLQYLDFVARLSVNHFVAQYFASKN